MLKQTRTGLRGAHGISDHFSDDEIKALLERHPKIRLAILFGSVAKGRATVESDLDLAVSTGRPLTLAEKTSLIEDLAAATGRPIDLIDLSTVGEPLLGQILKDGRRIIDDHECFAALLFRHLVDEADFLPYRNRILEQRRKAWIGI